MLIAGSSRGIGAAAARLAARQGATVVLHGRTDSAHLRGLASELDAHAIHCDGGDAASVSRAVRELERSGVAVDALICALGAVTGTPVLEGDTDEWLELFRANLLAPVHFIRAVAPGMVARGKGHIVTVSSIRGRDAMASSAVAAYSAAKAALENVTVSFAKELAPAITVNAVAPGFTLTDMSQTWTEAVQEQVSRNLLGRAATPEEIAAVLVFLASDAASFITAQTVLVDGGLEARSI